MRNLPLTNKRLKEIYGSSATKIADDKLCLFLLIKVINIINQHEMRRHRHCLQSLQGTRRRVISMVRRLIHRWSLTVAVECFSAWRHGHYVMRILWIIWKIADPQTTKMKRASSHGPTGYLSSPGFKVLGTVPRAVTFLLAFSFANRITCLEGIFLAIKCVWRCRKYSKIRR